MSERYDTRDADWPLRPWIMAGICALAGLLLEFLGDTGSYAAVSAARQASAAFVAVAAISFVLTVEQRRWQWSLAFALGWGVVIALVGWFTASYNQRPEIFEFPFLSGLFAVLLAAPLFQTMRDEGARRFPYSRLHAHAWTDAVIGAASLAFVGITFLLAWLIAGLFDVIGIDAVKDLLGESWFGWMLSGFAFGAAVGLLRERDALVGTLQRLVMVVLGVLAPVLAAALTLFLLSLPFTGLGELWDSSVPATPLMLVAGAGAILLANAVIGDGKKDGGTHDRPTNRVLLLSSLVLVLCVLPLAIIAAVSLGQRIDQYGWTPERMWGVVAVLVAIGYGVVGWWTVAKGRESFDDLLRPLQTKLALGLCGIALFLALPILDFGAISANSQMTRFAAGRTPEAKFDWQAMAFDFGPAGRARLAEIARTGAPEQRRLAATALVSKNRYRVGEEVAAVEDAAVLDSQMRVIPEGRVLAPDIRVSIAATRLCRVARCIVMFADESHLVVAGAQSKKEGVRRVVLTPDFAGRWSSTDGLVMPLPTKPFKPDLMVAPVELRRVERRQLHIDGKPVGEAF